jgi:hypothetical protein
MVSQRTHVVPFNGPCVDATDTMQSRCQLCNHPLSAFFQGDFRVSNDHPALWAINTAGGEHRARASETKACSWDVPFRLRGNKARRGALAEHTQAVDASRDQMGRNTEAGFSWHTRKCKVCSPYEEVRKRRRGADRRSTAVQGEISSEGSRSISRRLERSW